MCLIAIGISRAKSDCNRLTTVQDIQDYISFFLGGHGVQSQWQDNA